MELLLCCGLLLPVQDRGHGQHHEGLRRARAPRADRPVPRTYQVHGHPRRAWCRHPWQEGDVLLLTICFRRRFCQGQAWRRLFSSSPGIRRHHREEDRAGTRGWHLRRADDAWAVQHGGGKAGRLPAWTGHVTTTYLECMSTIDGGFEFRLPIIVTTKQRPSSRRICFGSSPPRHKISSNWSLALISSLCFWGWFDHFAVAWIACMDMQRSNGLWNVEFFFPFSVFFL
jgi:hypothetical protein